MRNEIATQTEKLHKGTMDGIQYYIENVDSDIKKKKKRILEDYMNEEYPYTAFFMKGGSNGSIEDPGINSDGSIDPKKMNNEIGVQTENKDKSYEKKRLEMVDKDTQTIRYLKERKHTRKKSRKERDRVSLEDGFIEDEEPVAKRSKSVKLESFSKMERLVLEEDNHVNESWKGVISGTRAKRS